MFFDRQLTWKDHINYIIDRCQKRLNLMRSLTGSTWGAPKAVLLTVYRALIRSIIEYGAFVYDDASVALKSKLDSIQYKALSLCTGAIKGTALLSLQNGEQPLFIRRRSQMLQFALKIKSM